MPQSFMTTRNARFWTFHRTAWVKLTLRPGQSLTARTFSRDDEGSSWEMDTWSHEGDDVLLKWGSGGTDCDGRVSRTGEGVCALDALATVPAYLDDASRMEPLYARSFHNRTKEAGAHHGGIRIHRPAFKECAPVRCSDSYAAAAGY